MRSDGSISILTGSADGSTWEAKKISNAHTIGCNAVSWGPSVAPGALIDEPGSHMANPPPKRFVSGGCDNLVKVRVIGSLSRYRIMTIDELTLGLSF